MLTTTASPVRLSTGPARGGLINRKAPGKLPLLNAVQRCELAEAITPERLWLLFIDQTRKTPDSAPLADFEATAMMKSHIAWTGKYVATDQTPEGIKVTVHVDTASNQAIPGTDRLYFMRVNGNKLMVKSPGVIVPVTGATSIIEFELVRAE